MGDLYIETPIGSAKCKLREVDGDLSLPYPIGGPWVSGKWEVPGRSLFRNTKDDPCSPHSEKFSLDNAALPFLAYSGIPAVSFWFCEVRLKNSAAFSVDPVITETKFFI